MGFIGNVQGPQFVCFLPYPVALSLQIGFVYCPRTTVCLFYSHCLHRLFKCTTRGPQCLCFFLTLSHCLYRLFKCTIVSFMYDAYLQHRTKSPSRSLDIWVSWENIVDLDSSVIQSLQNHTNLLRFSQHLHCVHYMPCLTSPLFNFYHPVFLPTLHSTLNTYFFLHKQGQINVELASLTAFGIYVFP